jgi:Tol biopolymer transport system component
LREDFETLHAHTPHQALLPEHRRLTVKTTLKRFSFAATSLALVLGAAACGGGEEAQPAATLANALDTERATALGRRKPPPPPPAPVTDSTLALASASASGTAADGNPCAVSADGGKVLFMSSSNTLVSADPSPFTADIYLKDFNGNGVTRVVNAFSPSLTCLAMTPDAKTVVFISNATNGQVDVLGNSGTELAILVKNLSTGVQTRVTPLLSSLANVDAYQFAGVSDDGLRVAFIAQPTRTCNIYDCTANGPARMFVRDLASGALINLENQVRFTTSQGVADGEAWLSPNGRTLAFASRVAYPQAGDTNTTAGDVFAFDIASGSVRLVNTDAAGRQVTVPGFAGIGPMFGVQTFLANSSKIAIYTDYDTSAGAAGVYVKDLATGALNRVLDRNLTYLVGNRAALSFSDDGRKVAYVESTGGGLTANSIPRVLDIVSGARLNAATLTNGTVSNGRVTTGALLSRDGSAVVFGNNATNLLGGVSPLGGAELRAYRKLVP